MTCKKGCRYDADNTQRIRYVVLQLGLAVTIPNEGSLEPLNTPPALVTISVDPPGQNQATLPARGKTAPARLQADGKLPYQSSRHPPRCWAREERLGPSHSYHNRGKNTQEQLTGKDGGNRYWEQPTPSTKAHLHVSDPFPAPALLPNHVSQGSCEG